MQFYTTETLSPNRELTPEGYLLCRATRVARTGTQLYAAAEVPVRAVDGVVRIERDEGEVFRPATLHSFQAKPVTLDHPATDVTPDNWTQLAKGLMLDVRRGAGLDSDFIVADLLLTDAALIRAVTANQIRELSAGYTADYQEIQPGRGRQTNIVGNHLALVDKGRCGARCSIVDTRPMRKTRSKWFDSLRAAFQARDERTFEETLTRDADEEETEEEKKKRLAKEKEDDEEEKKKTSDALGKLAATLKTLDARLAKLETRDADEEDETEEEKKKRLAKEKKEKEEKEENSASRAARGKSRLRSCL